MLVKCRALRDTSTRRAAEPHAGRSALTRSANARVLFRVRRASNHALGKPVVSADRSRCCFFDE
jgi:hypothetical protein